MRREVPADDYYIGHETGIFGQKLSKVAIISVASGIQGRLVEDVLEEVEEGPDSDNPV